MRTRTLRTPTFRTRPYRTLYYVGHTCVRVGHTTTFRNAIRRAGAWVSEADPTALSTRGKGFTVSTVIEDVFGNVLHNIEGHVKANGTANVTITTLGGF